MYKTFAGVEIMANAKGLFTIGHSNHSIKKFIELLQMHRIDCLVDVRSNPYSKFQDQFNREVLAAVLKQHKILYVFMGEELGARRDDKDLYTEGYVDFGKTQSSLLFQEGIQRVRRGIEKGYKIALMCAEKIPADCHRTILVSRTFHELGHLVQHILEDGSLLAHSTLVDQLVNELFPNRNQFSLIPEDNMMDEEELIKRVYRIKNREIGYATESEENK